MESSHLLYHRNGFSVLRRHGVGAGQSVQNLKVVRMGQERFQPDTDPKRLMIEKRKVQKQGWVGYFFKKRNKIKQTQVAPEPPGVILAPWRPILFMDTPPLCSGRSLVPAS